MKSKSTEIEGPDLLEKELRELKVMYEHLEDQVGLKEQAIERLEHIRNYL